MRIHAVLACFNRREKTELCMTRLFSQSVSGEVVIGAYVLDDGSSDGTYQMLRRCFPSVEVLRGNGNLFWAGGMRVAWHAAARSDPDYFLLLNDDTFLYADALAALLRTAGPPRARRIAVGAIADPRTGLVTYGGVRRVSGLFAPRGKAEPCDTFNANAVLVPRQVYTEMGGFHPAYTHSMADYDYGFEAGRAGIEILQTPAFIGTCSRNSTAGTWCDRSLPRAKRLRLLREPKGLPLRAWTIYNRRNSGWRWPLCSVSPYVRVLLGL